MHIDFRNCVKKDTGNDIHPVTVDVVLFDNHVAHVDANPEPYAAVFWQVGVALGHRRLNGKRISHSSHRAWKFDEYSIACGLYDAPAVGGDSWVN